MYGSHNIGVKAMMVVTASVRLLLLCVAARGQQVTGGWQEDVRRYADAKDWIAAMATVDREMDRAPQDMDVRAWRARVLMWSGKLAEAELEYRIVLAAAANDPDNWLGLATVLYRLGRPREALQALDCAVELDPQRTETHIARARSLQAIGAVNEARLEFSRTLALDPTSVEGRAGLSSLRGEPKHELRIGVNRDLFNFTDANQDEGLTLISRWTSVWRTRIGFDGYHWGGTDAEKVEASLTRKLPRVGALTVGGAAGHDNSVIPKDEGFFDYDQGFRLSRTRFLHGLELVYGQHWYWYTTARILTVNETMLFYLPRDWTWSLGLIEARSHFPGTGAEWRPSGMTRLGFPIANWEQRRLGGNVFFAVGTENFAQVNQIGEFSSQTFGGGLRLQLTERQDVTGFADYQRRTQDRTEKSFGFTYGIRF